MSEYILPPSTEVSSDDFEALKVARVLPPRIITSSHIGDSFWLNEYDLDYLAVYDLLHNLKDAESDTATSVRRTFVANELLDTPEGMSVLGTLCLGPRKTIRKVNLPIDEEGWIELDRSSDGRQFRGYLIPSVSDICKQSYSLLRESIIKSALG